MSPQLLVIALQLCLVQLKFFHMVYYTPWRLFSAGWCPDPNCPRCGTAPGHFYYVVWDCPVIVRYWTSIFRELPDVTGLHLDLSPRVALLEILVVCGAGCGDCSLVGIRVVLNKRDIARAWVAASPLKLASWRQAMDWCLTMEEAVYRYRGCPRKHPKIGGKWKSFYGLL